MARGRLREESWEASVTRAEEARAPRLFVENEPRRFFPAIDPEAPAAPAKRSFLATPFFVGALVLVAIGRTIVLRVLLPIALAIAAVFMLLRRRPASEKRATGSSKRAEVPARGIAIDGERVVFQHRGEALAPPPVPAADTILSFGGAFGVTLVSAHRRDRLVAVLTSRAGTFTVGTCVSPESRAALAPLLDRASAVASDEVALEAIAGDGEPLLLSSDDFIALVGALEARNPSCLDRFVLTDTRGQELTLDGRCLTIGDRLVDLTSPLEWRSLVFQEPFGQAVAVYQGTWIRQGATELVVVSLLSSLAPASAMEADLASLDRGAMRDLRLMQASPEQPPPADQRVAIERLFMLPLRSALDMAPRASHQPDAAHT